MTNIHQMTASIAPVASMQGTNGTDSRHSIDPIPNAPGHLPHLRQLMPPETITALHSYWIETKPDSNRTLVVFGGKAPEQCDPDDYAVLIAPIHFDEKAYATLVVQHPNNEQPEHVQIPVSEALWLSYQAQQTIKVGSMLLQTVASPHS